MENLQLYGPLDVYIDDIDRDEHKWNFLADRVVFDADPSRDSARVEKVFIRGASSSRVALRIKPLWGNDLLAFVAGLILRAGL
jgi:hypothetical protein